MASILGFLSVGATALWAHGGGGRGGGGARGGGAVGVRGASGPRGVVAVRAPGFAGVAVRRPAFVGERFHRFGFRRGFNNVIIAGGGYPYAYYGGYPYGSYNPAPPTYDPYAAQNASVPPVAELNPLASQCPGLVAGDVVGNVQRVLRYRGFYRGPIDGLSGPATRAAIRAYDASVGLPPTGMIDARLLLSMQLM